MSKVAVTGGAGFLGSHVVRRLLDDGRRVSVVDDMSSGSVQNLLDLGIKEECVVGDLKDYGFAKKSIKGADAVFHFAAEVGSVTYLHGSEERELAALQANLVIDANVFRACQENRVRTLIFASSVSVYPFDEQLKAHARFREDDSEKAVRPEGGYGWSKYIAEKQLALMSGTSCGIARIFHAYGKNIYLREDRSQVIASLIRKAVRYPEEDFVIWGSGTQSRCFIYVEDAIDAIMRLEEHVARNGSLTVNVGSTDEITVKDLADLIVRISGKKIRLKFDRSKPMGAMSREPDLTRVRRALGWKPTTPLDVGMRETFRWAEERLTSGTP